jgi:exopolysaccharide production protein ExoQ
MSPLLASLICACGIGVLFYLNREDSIRTSKALWLPVIYFWIIGSRPFSAWLGLAPADGTNVQLEGSPIDALFFGLLLVAAVIVLILRGKRTRNFLTSNWPILIYFFYCLLSVAWAYHPDVAFKRWIKALDDIAMVLVIVTDEEPVAAFRRLISRVGFILLPVSVLFIRYFNDLGHAYDPGGGQSNTGVTTNKNALGVIVLVISMVTLWNVRWLITHKGETNRARRLIAQGALLAFGLALFGMANCATCIACFILGGGLILATNLSSIKIRPARVHILCLAIIFAGGIILLFGGQGDAVHALGRESNLSGRTEIWAAVIPAVSNPIIGDGYESFWIGPNVQKVSRRLVGWWHPEDLNEAHDGYIEVYLSLGWIGVVLIGLVLTSGYRRAVAAFRINPQLGGLMLAYIIVAAVYSITESGFRSPHPMWVFLLFAIVSASGVSAGLFVDEKPNVPASSVGINGRSDIVYGIGAERKIVHTARWFRQERRE